MTVYVDDMKAKYQPRHRPTRTYVMCHMIADTEAELHAMAARLGIMRRWYQGDHYDITQSKRSAAVALGAREITQRQLGAMVFNRRASGSLGDPETAEQVAFDRIEQRREQRNGGANAKIENQS